MKTEQPGPLLAEPNDTTLMTAHPAVPSDKVAHGDFSIKTMPFVVHTPEPAAPVIEEAVEHPVEEEHVEHPVEHVEEEPVVHPTVSLLDGESLLA